MAKDKTKGAWRGVVDVIKTVAPTVAAALGSPLAGAATKMIIDSLGVDNEEMAIQAIGQDPNALLKLKTAELDLKKFMRDADIREDEVFLADRQDARDLAKKLGSVAPQLSIVVALTFMTAGVIYALFTFEPPESTENILFMVLGQLMTAWAASIHFFVGTTKSSSEKTSHMRALADVR